MGIPDREEGEKRAETYLKKEWQNFSNLRKKMDPSGVCYLGEIQRPGWSAPRCTPGASGTSSTVCLASWFLLWADGLVGMPSREGGQVPRARVPREPGGPCIPFQTSCSIACPQRWPDSAGRGAMTPKSCEKRSQSHFKTSIWQGDATGVWEKASCQALHTCSQR